MNRPGSLFVGTHFALKPVGTSAPWFDLFGPKLKSEKIPAVQSYADKTGLSVHERIEKASAGSLPLH